MATARLESQFLGGVVDPTEPVFVLRGQDPLAPDLVKLWAVRARLEGTPEAKVQEALAHADVMREWPVKKVPD